MSFPSALGYQQKTYRFSVSPNVARTSFHSNNTRQRKIIESRDDTFHVSIVTDDAGLSDFEDFIFDEINNGADTFDGPYYVSSVEEVGTLEIPKGNFAAESLGPDAWNITYSFIVKDRDISGEENIYEIVEGVGGFDALNLLMQATEDAVNNNNL